MNVNNNFQGLQQLFASRETGQAAGKAGAAGAQPGQGEAGGADKATLSTAASLAAAAAAAPDSDVRMEKVTAIQQALASGTYNVPASEVASKMIEGMLGR
jgi:negative regulator of flagellin synthesis FlgM